jgi:hypothetical protein
VCSIVLALAACGTPANAPRDGSATGTTSSHTATRTLSPAQIAPSTTLLSTSSTTAALGPLTSPPLPPPAAGFRPGIVTAIGDSVMLDAAPDLQQDIPGIQIDAAVSRQWTEGEAILSELKAHGDLGAIVVVGLGTNGPITLEDFNQMMSILDGRPWWSS